MLFSKYQSFFSGLNVSRNTYMCSSLHCEICNPVIMKTYWILSIIPHSNIVSFLQNSWDSLWLLWIQTMICFLNTLRPEKNGRHFADDIFKCIFLNENVWIAIKISLKFVPRGPINNIPALVQIMAWRRPGDKPLSEPMMIRLPTHICVTRPQWVNSPLSNFMQYMYHDDIVTWTHFPHYLLSVKGIHQYILTPLTVGLDSPHTMG